MPLGPDSNIIEVNAQRLGQNLLNQAAVDSRQAAEFKAAGQIELANAALESAADVHQKHTRLMGATTTYLGVIESLGLSPLTVRDLVQSLHVNGNSLTDEALSPASASNGHPPNSIEAMPQLPEALINPFSPLNPAEVYALGLAIASKVELASRAIDLKIIDWRINNKQKGQLAEILTSFSPHQATGKVSIQVFNNLAVKLVGFSRGDERIIQGSPAENPDRVVVEMVRGLPEENIGALLGIKIDMKKINPLLQGLIVTPRSTKEASEEPENPKRTPGLGVGGINSFILDVPRTLRREGGNRNFERLQLDIWKGFFQLNRDRNNFAYPTQASIVRAIYCILPMGLSDAEYIAEEKRGSVYVSNCAKRLIAALKLESGVIRKPDPDTERDLYGIYHDDIKGQPEFAPLAAEQLAQAIRRGLPFSQVRQLVAA